jgi:dipeptidyl aminopeptidase/acylaminoacyl peptidase
VNGKIKKLAEVSPWLNEKNMSPMKPVQYKSRDGLTINGYLTLPAGKKAENLPVVINPHGGPWTRNFWGFNEEAQFLANRGYAVLQMNYRGSTGYGKDFHNAGFKQWGNKMQDDITDGVNWLLRQNIADEKRIAIYGASFGGYAALCGITFTPDLYCCGVSYTGISNIKSFLSSIPSHWEPFREMLYELVGDPVKDSVMLEKYSPFYHLDNIKVPVFIAQGANDPRVPIKDTEQIVKTLKKNGVDVTYMMKEHEGHGFKNEENRLDFYKSLEKFLAKNLKGRAAKN